MRTLFNPLKVATVDRVYTRSREVRADVSLSDGSAYRGVSFMVQGGGASSYQYTAPLVGSSVLLLFPDGSQDLPYIIGGEFLSVLPDSDGSVVGDAEYTPSNADTVLSRSDSTLSLSESGITQSAPTVRIQLPTGGVLRISLDGGTSDSPLNGQAFIDALFPWVTGINAKVEAMMAVLDIMAPHLSALISSTDPTSAAAITLAVQTANALSVPSPTTVRSNAEDAINNTIKLP